MGPKQRSLEELLEDNLILVVSGATQPTQWLRSPSPGQCDPRVSRRRLHRPGPRRRFAVYVLRLTFNVFWALGPLDKQTIVL